MSNSAEEEYDKVESDLINKELTIRSDSKNII